MDVPAIPIQLRHIQYLAVIIEEGQISRAATRLHVAQPALSQAVRKLERALGVQLLRRHPWGVTPTQAGHAFLRSGRLALEAARDAAAAARMCEAAAPLVVGFLPPWTETATEILATVEFRGPNPCVEVRELPDGDALGLLLNGNVDVAFLWASPEHAELVREPVFEDRRTVVLRASHPLARQSRLSIAELSSASVEASPTYKALVDPEDGRPRPVSGPDGHALTFHEIAALVEMGRALYVGPATLTRALVRPGVVVRPVVGAKPPVLSLVRHRSNCDQRVLGLFQAARGRTDPPPSAGGPARRAQEDNGPTSPAVAGTPLSDARSETSGREVRPTPPLGSEVLGARVRPRRGGMRRSRRTAAPPWRPARVT